MGKRSVRAAEKFQRMLEDVRIREAEDRRQPQRARPFEPRTHNQRLYLDSIARNDVTFGFGIAGSGKTYLAAGAAARAFAEGMIEKIVVCRPAIEAGGEDIGYLPGNISEKLDPYVQPVFDAFSVFWSRQKIAAMLGNRIIEVVPLGFCRGRTFMDCFVIADEMQNANESLLIMLLTRLGAGSKMVITGDPTQRDIGDGMGFLRARERLVGLPGIGFVEFGRNDVIRHPLVEKILDAW